MDDKINATQLRTTLADVVNCVRNGARFTVLYRSRPAFRIVPMDWDAMRNSGLAEDSLYRAAPVGRSRRRLALKQPPHARRQLKSPRIRD
jgi:antitoxin (DNA-binding transcriptional repressor) of toxin-antitoxin stability system